MILPEPTTAPGGISARVVKDSTFNGRRIVSVETKSPVFIDAEIEKHRIISTNSTSSRAVPMSKALVGYLPHDVRINQGGMQGYDRISDEELERFHADLKDLLDYTKSTLEKWKHVHKQHVNRYLSPFLYQHKLWTATEWDNFFVLRLPFEELNEKQQRLARNWEKKFGGLPNGLNAQPEIQALARCIKTQMDESEPEKLDYNEWHLPYVESYGAFTEQMLVQEVEGVRRQEAMIKCSVARCARVSYNNHNQTQPEIKRDIELYDSLLASYHMTPFEHQAQPMLDPVFADNAFINHRPRGVTHMDHDQNLGSANFKGWVQYRKYIEN